MYRWDIINHLIKKYNYKSYLEIGYYKGWSFDQVKCGSIHAVDPNPCKNQEQLTTPYKVPILDNLGVIHKMTSDEYFELINKKEVEEKSKITWDIIFIDGLHEAQQVLRDYQNAKKHLSKGGSIIFHDCNPPKYEHTTTGIDGCWTGDVYKTILQIAANPHNNFYTVDTDWGVGVYKDISVGMAVNYIPSMIRYTENWDLFDQDREDLLRLITPEEFLEREKIAK